MRRVLINFHIMKNAGHTIEWILDKNFKENFAMTAYFYDRGMKLEMDLLVDFLKKNPIIKAFSSQIIRFPIPIEKELQIIPIVFIRHPIDRAFSLYNFFKNRLVEDNESIKKAKSCDLKEFISWKLVEKKDRVIRNHQVHFLSDKSLNEEEKRYLSVETRIKNTPIIGVVDRFDESMVLAEETLKKFFPTIDFSYIKQNVGRGRSDQLKKKVELGKAEIGEDFFDLLLRNNEKDLRLYYFINEELDRRIKQIENFQQKLEDFQLRCKKIGKEEIILKQGIQLKLNKEKKVLEEIPLTKLVDS